MVNPPAWSSVDLLPKKFGMVTYASSSSYTVLGMGFGLVGLAGKGCEIAWTRLNPGVMPPDPEASAPAPLPKKGSGGAVDGGNPEPESPEEAS